MTGKIIFVIFIVALFIRFLYFPDNVYFSYDQARDFFASLQILHGHLKLLGPPSFLSDKLFPGPLIFYIYAPILAFFDKSPEIVSAFLRIYNAMGVFLVFAIGSLLFNRKVGLISALFFAFSYEQTQYSLYLLHQPLAVITVLLFYLGLALFIFQKKQAGLILSAGGLGLSMQFHYGYIYLFLVLLILIIYFRKEFKSLQIKYTLLSLLVLLVTTSSFLLVEIRYHFFSSFIMQAFSPDTPKVLSGLHFKETLFTTSRFLHDNLLTNYQLTPVVALFLIISLFYFSRRKNLKPKIVFLLVWFLGGLSLYLLSGVSSYYYSAGTSITLIIFVSFIIYNLFSSSKIFLAIVLTISIIINNLIQIVTVNPQGLNSDMAIQPGMLTSSQRQVLNYVYKNADGKPFAIRALTVPLDVNTTWSYLFEWYGQKKYHYLPTWIGPSAAGFPGNLKIEDAHSKLPQKQFLVIEPTVGIREAIIDNFFREEGYFTKVIEEKHFGAIVVQLRQPY